MRIILDPISHPEMREITIEDTLFSIGRREEPFASQHDTSVAKLSRRHARIFREHGKAYIIDLGSLNGTHINDRPLDKEAAQLHSGDTVDLGGEYSFKVRIEVEEDAEEGRSDEPPVKLTLIPVDSNDSLEAIVVSRYPFLVSRTSDVFSRYQDRLGDELRQISKRHAAISLKGHDVYVEDLESTNGTFVSGIQLDEHARQLLDGDTIAFAGERFSYQIKLEKTEHTQGTETVALDTSGNTATYIESDSRTTFVNSATSFLDIFCADDAEDGASASSEENVDAGENKSATSAFKGHPGRFRKIRTGFSELRNALRTDSKMDRRKLWAGVGVAAAGVAILATIHILGADRREIKELLDEKDYRESAVVANQYLAKHPDDDEASAWGQKALIKALVPGWLVLLNRGDFEDASAYLQTEKPDTRHMPQGEDLIDLLDWIGRLEAHLDNRGGTGAQIIVFRDEDSIRELVEEWSTDERKHRRLISQIGIYEPSFEEVQSRALSKLRTLRNEHSIYGSAIATLKYDLQAGLDRNDPEKLYSVIREFKVKYPRIGGTDSLMADAKNFEVLSKHMERKNLTEVVQLRNTVVYQTPLFQEHVNNWLSGSLPPENIIAEYNSAVDAWSRGQLEDAVAILEPLISETWGEVASNKIERYRKVYFDYETLKLSRGRDDHKELLLSFRASLDPVEDIYFVESIQPDFEQYKAQILAQLDGTYSKAKSQWDAYQNDGGISGVVRVEEGVSGNFKTQAGRLSSAYDQVAQAAHMHELLRIEQAPAWRKLDAEIVNEVRRQRSWLEDLDVVLDPGLLRAKLDLLPEIREGGK